MQNINSQSCLSYITKCALKFRIDERIPYARKKKETNESTLAKHCWDSNLEI